MRHVARILLHSTLLLLSAVMMTSLATAQYGASLQGTVTDKTGAVIVGAIVAVINEATGVSHSTVTSDSGFYRVPGLTPGKY